MPKVSSQVDRRSVVNPRQARALLGAVRAQQPSGPRLVTFFAVMYYAGLRPEEAISLSRDNVIMPTHDRPDSRVVPTHPELTRLLREHLDKFGTAPDGVSSAVSGAANCRPSPTGAPGSKRARQL
jgi:integrase